MEEWIVDKEGDVCDSARHSFGSSFFLGWSRMANGWNAPPNEVALIEIGAGQSAGNAAQMRLYQYSWDPTCCWLICFWCLWMDSVTPKNPSYDLFFSKSSQQRTWPNTWNHSSKRSLCLFWLWLFILYAQTSLHPDWGQLQPVFWFMPSNLNPFKLPLLANSQCVVVSKSHYLPST